MSKSNVAVFFLLSSATAFAYIGPGAGISVLGSLLGILSTILLAIVAIVAWPLRKLMKRRKATASSESDSVETADSGE